MVSPELPASSCIDCQSRSCVDLLPLLLACGTLNRLSLAGRGACRIERGDA